MTLEPVPKPEGAGNTLAGPAKTPTLLGIQKVLRDCFERVLLGVVTGAPGIGKTTAGLDFARSTRRVVYYRASPVAVTSAAFIRDFSRHVGVHSRERQGCLSINGEIKSRLSDPWNGTKLIVADEAQALSINAIETLREYFDTCRVGLCFLGNSELAHKVTHTKSDDKLAPMVSRAEAELHIEASLPEDLLAVASHQGLDARCTDWIVSLGSTIGLRRMISIINRARQMSTDNQITKADLEAAIKHVLGHGQEEHRAKRKSS